METNELTLENLRAVYHLLEDELPFVYYATSKWVERGMLFRTPQTECSPECYLFNEEDFIDLYPSSRDIPSWLKHISTYRDEPRLPLEIYENHLRFNLMADKPHLPPKRLTKD